jgi:hypothetical protein
MRIARIMTQCSPSPEVCQLSQSGWPSRPELPRRFQSPHHAGFSRTVLANYCSWFTVLANSTVLFMVHGDQSPN